MIPIIPVGENAAARSVNDLHLQDGSLRLAALPPLGLYIHFPWCVRKCPYCDFNSHQIGAQGNGFAEEEYLAALRADLEQALPLIWGRRVHSVFIGGGTPSLLSEAGVDRLLADVRARVLLEPDAEITLEANPGTFEAARFAAYRQSGVNRLSLGIQSLDDRSLAALGRIHDANAARQAIVAARSIFDNFNLDLMYALPHQDVDGAVRDLEALLSFDPPHVSLYHLTLEPNTVFAKYPPPLPHEDEVAEMQDRLLATLAAAGLARYEISAFAKAQRRSRHNLNYWHFGDYLGIGAGAHGKLSFAHRILRQSRVRMPESFISRVQAGETPYDEAEVTREALPFEFFLNALRLVEGVPARLFRERTGLSLSVVAEPLQRARQRGLLEDDALVLKATPLGLRFLNDLQEMFLP